MNFIVRRIIKCRNCHLFVLSEGQLCFAWCLVLFSVPSQWCYPLGEVVGGKVREREENKGSALLSSQTFSLRLKGENWHTHVSVSHYMPDDGSQPRVPQQHLSHHTQEG